MGFQVRREGGSLPFKTLGLSSDSKAFPITINMETWLFVWAYSPPFMHKLAPRGWPSRKEAWGGGAGGGRSRGLAGHPGLDTAPPL